MKGIDDLLDALCRHLETGESDECDLFGLRDLHTHLERDSIRRSILLAGERIRRALSTEHLVRQLDERYLTDGERWDPYRLWNGGFGIEMRTPAPGDPLKRTVTAPTFEEALALAIASKRIPMVPKRPKSASVSDYRIEKRDSGRYAWHVLSPDGGLVMRAPTRREAQAGIERWVDRINDGIAEWDAKWAQLTTEGTEGTDFIWSAA